MVVEAGVYRPPGPFADPVDPLEDPTHPNAAERSSLIGHGLNAPTEGSHEAGEIVFHSAPVAGGKIGWVCVSAGTPGTWCQWGPIDA